MKWLATRRSTLHEGFSGGVHQDATEFLDKLFAKFSKESKPFEIAYHLLFSAYYKNSKICDNSHESINVGLEKILALELEDPDENGIKTYHLTNLIKQFVSRREIVWPCPKCNHKNKKSFI